MNLVSGFSAAAAVVASAMRKPTVTMTSYFVVRELGDVRRVVLGVLGLDVLVEAALVLGRGLGALVGGLVERLVVDLPGVGHEADAEHGGVRAVRVVGRGAGRGRAGVGAATGVSGAAAAAGEGQGERRGNRDEVTRGLHGGSPREVGSDVQMLRPDGPGTAHGSASLRGRYPARAGAHQPGAADHPASTVTVVPVMPDAAGEARKATVAATSSAVTGRPRDAAAR